MLRSQATEAEPAVQPQVQLRDRRRRHRPVRGDRPRPRADRDAAQPAAGAPDVAAQVDGAGRALAGGAGAAQACRGLAADVRRTRGFAGVSGMALDGERAGRDHRHRAVVRMPKQLRAAHAGAGLRPAVRPGRPAVQIQSRCGGDPARSRRPRLVGRVRKSRSTCGCTIRRFTPRPRPGSAIPPGACAATAGSKAWPRQDGRACSPFPKAAAQLRFSGGGDGGKVQSIDRPATAGGRGRARATGSSCWSSGG